MITIVDIKKYAVDGGATLKNGVAKQYKSGWQVATEGVVVKENDFTGIIEAITVYDGNCGLWFDGGFCYIDKSHRVSTKREAMEIGRAHNQISVLRWRDMVCVNC